MPKRELKYMKSPLTNPRVRSGLLNIKKQYADNKDYLDSRVEGSIDEANLESPKFKFSQANESYNLRKGDKLNIGTNTITITDPYGIRSFEGREDKHSTGIDYKTNNNMVVALTDGIIEDVKLDGDGSVIKPTEGSAGGYYLIVRNPDGTRSQYMHLDPMTKDEMDALKGKEIKKGDEIWGYGTGSGSMTGPHVKYRVYTGNVGSQSHINPVSYILK